MQAEVKKPIKHYVVKLLAPPSVRHAVLKDTPDDGDAEAEDPELEDDDEYEDDREYEEAQGISSETQRKPLCESLPWPITAANDGFDQFVGNSAASFLFPSHIEYGSYYDRQKLNIDSNALGAFKAYTTKDNVAGGYPWYTWHSDISPDDVRVGQDLYGTWRQGWDTLQSMYPSPIPGTSCVIPTFKNSTCEITIRDPKRPPMLLLWADRNCTPEDELRAVMVSIAKQSETPIILHEVQPYGNGLTQPWQRYYDFIPMLKATGCLSDATGYRALENRAYVSPAMLKKYISKLPAGTDWDTWLKQHTWLWYCPPLVDEILERHERQEKKREARAIKKDRQIPATIYCYDIDALCRELAYYNSMLTGPGYVSCSKGYKAAESWWAPLLRQFQLISKPGAYRKLQAYQELVRKMKLQPKQRLREKHPELFAILDSELKRRLPPVVNAQNVTELIDWKRVKRLWPGVELIETPAAASADQTYPRFNFRNWIVPAAAQNPEKAEATADT